MRLIRPTLAGLMFVLAGAPSVVRAQAVEPVRCFFASLNAHDFQAMMTCYAPSAVTVRRGRRFPVDFDASRGYREFDAKTRAKFYFDVRSANDSIAEIVLHEENDFLRALGLAEVTADWRYVVRGGVIAEEHHTRADSAFAARFREFVEWGRATQPSRWASVLDGVGNVVFNGATADALVALGQQWSKSQR
jgi:ketosteroid isomerase-like protein